MHLIELPNFFKNPYKIREDALNEPFHTPSDFLNFGVRDRGENWPGYRTYAGLEDLDGGAELLEEVKTQLRDLNIFKGSKGLSMDTVFHLIPESQEGGRNAHVDVGWFTHVCVVYLTPDPKPKCGTVILNPDTEEVMEESLNEFNKGIIYPASSYHNAAGFFGSTKDDSRLTLVAAIQRIEK